MGMFLEGWDPDRMMNNRSYHDGMFGGAWVMVLFGLLLIAVLGLLIFLAVRLAGPQHREGVSRPAIGSARDLLDQRLARGEVSPEEYRATRALLDP